MRTSSSKPLWLTRSLKACPPVVEVSVASGVGEGRVEVEYPDGVIARFEGKVDPALVQQVLASLEGG